MFVTLSPLGTYHLSCGDDNEGDNNEALGPSIQSHNVSLEARSSDINFDSVILEQVWARDLNTIMESQTYVKDSNLSQTETSIEPITSTSPYSDILERNRIRD